MAVQDIFVSDAGALNERSGDLATTILKAERGSDTPLFALSAGMKTFDMSDTTTTWYEEDIQYHRTIITNNAGDPLGQQMAVEDATWIKENSIFMVEQTGEYFYVLATNGNILSVQRGIGGTPIAPINPAADSVTIQLIGSAFEEGSERPQGHSINPHPRSNITQIFRDSWDISETAKAINYRFGPRMHRNKQLAGINHALDIEHSLIYGKRHNGVVNNKPLRMMDGFNAQIISNRFISPAGGLTRRSLTDYIERTFSTKIKGYPNERITFCGNVTLRALEEIAYRYGEYQLSPIAKVFGINVRKFVSSMGELTLMTHPLMQDSPVWSREMYSYHPAAMEIGYLRRTSHKDEMHGSASDLRDASAGVFTTELTCKYAMEQTGSIMSGIEIDHYVA